MTAMNDPTINPHASRRQAGEGEETGAPILPGAAVYLFLSIDMANSTAFKGTEPRWPFVIHNFYEDVVAEIRGVCPRFNVWKYIGDEVTFWRRMEPSDDLGRLVADSYGALQRIGAKLDALEDLHRIRTRNVIGAKATIWAAAAEHVGQANIGRDLERNYEHPNRIIEEEHIIALRSEGTSDQLKLYDFIGPDIDIGFRISHFAHQGLLLVGAGLAYLLCREEGKHGADRRMRIVSFEHLKGVWNDRPYPIIWYTDDWTDVADKFHYDERWSNPIVAAVLRQEHEDVAAIETILRHTNRLAAMAAMQHLLQA
jgi:hypothetical protein